MLLWDPGHGSVGSGRWWPCPLSPLLALKTQAAVTPPATSKQTATRGPLRIKPPTGTQAGSASLPGPRRPQTMTWLRAPAPRARREREIITCALYDPRRMCGLACSPRRSHVNAQIIRGSHSLANACVWVGMFQPVHGAQIYPDKRCEMFVLSLSQRSPGSKSHNGPSLPCLRPMRP